MFVFDKGFDAVDIASGAKFLGLFDMSHMEYEADRAKDAAGEPSLVCTSALLPKLSIRKQHVDETGRSEAELDQRLDQVGTGGDAGRTEERDEAVQVERSASSAGLQERRATDRSRTPPICRSAL